ncbi:hypothetical protein [Limnohabitans sp. T6-20]|uniref:hypothetical protein n=1 Tax=Limnohabitans sp. T6-20 TaxID=1100725 RepID=UPI000D3422B4|nr:hypothetical protein [Limnohabitans sp. T6-20]PUE12306.1 hypothetical protein B9Z33_01820 [Limnohabitans sp. T6-20]
MSNYFRTDTALDLVETLELTNDFFYKSKTDARYWKWFINALHSAVQSTASLALEAGNGFLIQEPKIAMQMMKADMFKPVSPRMDRFIDLVKKSLDKSNLRDSAIPFEANDCVIAFSSINDLRNDFAHFNVKSWSIEFMLILKNSSILAEYVEHYTIGTPAILWHDEEHQQRATKSVKNLRNLIQLRLTTQKRQVHVQGTTQFNET